MKQYKKMKNARRIQGTPVHENKPTEVTQETTQEENQEKVFLSESEQEGYLEYEQSKRQYTDSCAKLGSMLVQKKMLEETIAKIEHESILLSMQTESLEKRFAEKVSKKHGACQIGENFEVIKQKQ